ncbi:MAG: FKBP-type peptidyl-prolyl cis-trans isomerase [Prevotellaceae bacterium]|jgi:FKBP-type peptidyl-prolyl cis-trans isomerase SlyD|nr:FKBP-type peptidyl-prolyl cis-trans isomerase [Prevotellaceae bacterium]
MKISNQKVVAITYDLEVDNDIIQSVGEERPMEFIYGTGHLLPKFEEHLLSLQADDRYDFILEAADGYGLEDKEAFVELSKEMFMVDGVIEPELLKVGRVLPMSDSQGNRLHGSIDEVREDTIIMNFNHPLAGENLHFSGKIVWVRDATPDELLYGLNKAQQGCSPSACSSCSSGCK